MIKVDESAPERMHVRRATVSAVQEPDKTTWRAQWVTNKLSVVDRLRKEVEMSQYNPQMLIVGSILSALAAELWPSKYKDRQRFVELLVHYANPALRTRTISVPLLKRFLIAKGWEAEAKAIGERWCESEESEFMLGMELDAEEHELMAISPNLPRVFLRKFSYANLLYDEVQFGRERPYVYSNDIPSTEVGYNRLPENRQWATCFGADWLRALVISAEERSRAATVEKAYTNWWLQ
jgi:hypothetical protein